MSHDIGVASSHLAAHDPVMAKLIAAYPQPAFTKHPHYYRELMSSIISQQLSVKAAATIQARFVDLYGHKPRHPWRDAALAQILGNGRRATAVAMREDSGALAGHVGGTELIAREQNVPWHWPLHSYVSDNGSWADN